MNLDVMILLGVVVLWSVAATAFFDQPTEREGEVHGESVQDNRRMGEDDAEASGGVLKDSP